VVYAAAVVANADAKRASKVTAAALKASQAAAYLMGTTEAGNF